MKRLWMMVSVMVLAAVTAGFVMAVRDIDAPKPAALDEETCVALAYDRLASEMPNLPMYVVREYEEMEERQEHACAVHLAIPIGDYFFGQAAAVYFDRNGEITEVELPRRTWYERLDQETRFAILKALPARDDVPALIKAQMDEKHGEGNYTIMETDTLTVVKHEDGYALCCSVDVKTVMGWEVADIFVYPLV